MDAVVLLLIGLYFILVNKNEKKLDTIINKRPIMLNPEKYKDENAFKYIYNRVMTYKE